MLNINERKTKIPRHRCETNWEERNGLYFRSPLTSPSEGLNCVQIDRSSVRSNIQYISMCETIKEEKQQDTDN